MPPLCLKTKWLCLFLKPPVLSLSLQGGVVQGAVEVVITGTTGGIGILGDVTLAVLGTGIAVAEDTTTDQANLLAAAAAAVHRTAAMEETAAALAVVVAAALWRLTATAEEEEPGTTETDSPTLTPRPEPSVARTSRPSPS